MAASPPLPPTTSFCCPSCHTSSSSSTKLDDDNDELERVFNKASFDFKQSETTLSTIDKFILLSIDPPQGNDNELGGICACYYNGLLHPQVILHLDYVRPREFSLRTIKDKIHLTILSIRGRHACLQDVPIIIACEASPLIISSYVGSCVTDLVNEGHLSNVYVMRELDVDNDGVPETDANTQQMVNYTQILLNHHQVSFSTHFKTLTSSTTPGISASDDIKNMFVEQLDNFRKKKTPTQSIGGSSCFLMKGRDDSLVKAYIMNVYWYGILLISMNELRYRNIIPIHVRSAITGINLE